MNIQLNSTRKRELQKDARILQAAYAELCRNPDNTRLRAVLDVASGEMFRRTSGVDLLDDHEDFRGPWAMTAPLPFCGVSAAPAVPGIEERAYAAWAWGLYSTDPTLLDVPADRAMLLSEIGYCIYPGRGIAQSEYGDIFGAETA